MTTVRCAVFILALAAALAVAGSDAAETGGTTTATTPAAAEAASLLSSSFCPGLAGCASCTRSRGSQARTCTRCKDGAVLVAGNCSCPAGYGAIGSANTQRNGGRNRACSPCSAGAFAPVETPVSAARNSCVRCPTAGTSTPGAGSTSASDCTLARPGWYHDGSSLVKCLPDSYCTGNVPVLLATLTQCPDDSRLDTPQASGTKGAVGQDALADCVLMPGFYCVFLDPNVCTPTLCPAGSYCAGGASIASPGPNGGRSDCPLPSSFPACPNNGLACASVTSPRGSSLSTQCACVCPATVTTVAGTGALGATGDGKPALMAATDTPYGIAYNRKTGDYYFAQVGSDVLRKVSKAGIITTIAGIAGTSGVGAENVQARGSALADPTGVAVNLATGDVFVSDTGNNRIRKISSAGIVTTFAGIAGQRGYTGDGGPATLATLTSPQLLDFDQNNGILYFADEYACVVRRIDTAGFISTIAGTGACGYNGDNIAATTAQLNRPRDVKVVGTMLYIAEHDGQRVRSVNLNTNPPLINTIAGTGTAGFSGDGGPATAAQLRVPCGLAFDPLSGTLYVSEIANYRLRKITLGDGKITTAAGSGIQGFQDGAAASAQFSAPFGIAVKGFTGNVLIADLTNGRIREYAPALSA